jgi:hypothetical protein
VRRLKFLLLFGWTLLLLLAAAWRFPVPFSGGPALLASFACAAATGLAALGLGRALQHRGNLHQASLVQELVFSLGLGLAALSLLAAALGAAGLLFPLPAWLLVGLLLILNWEHLEGLGTSLWRNLRNKHPWEGSSTEIAILLVLSLSLATALMLALAPPSFYDALVYHLAQAQRAALTGRLEPQSGVLFTWLPSLPTPLWGLALALDGAPREQAWAPALLNMGLALALVLAIMDASARLLAERRLWLAAALALSQPLLMLSFGVFTPDAWAAFYAFLSLSAFLLALDERVLRTRDAWLLVAALLAGAAVACKPVAALHGAALLALLGGLAISDATWRRPGLLMAGLGLALLPLAPWLLQGLLLKGQPFYPFPLRCLGYELTAGAGPAYFAHMQAFGGQGWWAWLRLPYACFFDPASLGGDGHPTVLLLAAAPALLFLPLERPQRWLAAYLMAGALLWSLGPHVLRYALPFIPAACLLAAQGLVQAEAWAVSVSWTWAWRVLVLAGLLAGALQGLEIAVKDFDPLAAALQLEDPAAYLARRGVPQLALSRWMDAHGGGPDSPVLLLGDARSAWLPGGTLTASAFEPHPLTAWMAHCATAQEMDATVRRKGYDFVVLNGAEWQRQRTLDPPGPQYWAPGDAAAAARFDAWVGLLRSLPDDRRFEQGPLLAVRLR